MQSRISVSRSSFYFPPSPVGILLEKCQLVCKNLCRLTKLVTFILILVQIFFAFFQFLTSILKQPSPTPHPLNCFADQNCSEQNSGHSEMARDQTSAQWLSSGPSGGGCANSLSRSAILASLTTQQAG